MSIIDLEDLEKGPRITAWDKNFDKQVAVSVEIEPTMYRNTKFANKVLLAASLPGFVMPDWDLSFADFSHSDLICVTFDGTALKYADFIGAAVKNVRFQGRTELAMARFSRTVLTNVVFEQANILKDIDFSDVADATHVSIRTRALEHVFDDPTTSFTSAQAIAGAKAKALAAGITGLIPFKLIKISTAGPRYSDLDLFHERWTDVSADEALRLDGAHYVSSQHNATCFLALCWRPENSNDQTGQIRSAVAPNIGC